MAMTYDESHNYCTEQGESILQAENLKVEKRSKLVSALKDRSSKDAMSTFGDCCLSDLRLNAANDGDACFVEDDGDAVDMDALEEDNFAMNVNHGKEEEGQVNPTKQ